MKCSKWMVNLLVLVSSVMASGLDAKAKDTVVDGVHWTYSLSEDGAKVTGGGPSVGELAIPDTLDGYPVTSIGSRAFSKRKQLTSLVIPDSVKNIDLYDAFGDCTGLTSVIFGHSLTNIGNRSFVGCSGLTNLTFPDSLISLDDFAFEGCSELTTIALGNKIKSIGRNTFLWCAKLTNIVVPQWDCSRRLVDVFGDACKSITDIMIRDGIHRIEERAFERCSGLISITIPDSVGSIARNAFSDCTNLFDTTSIPGVRLVDGWVFGHDDSIAGNLDLTGVRGIADGAFSGCRDLTSVVIPDGVKGVGIGSFDNCSALFDKETLPGVCLVDGWAVAWDGLPTLDLTGSRGIAGGAFENCADVTNVTISDSVTCIGDRAFAGCTGLTEMVIPDSVASIGWNAFSGCSGLTQLTLPENIKRIGQETFSGCSNLVSVEIPTSVTSIEVRAFDGCSSLESVIIPEGVEQLVSSTFNGCGNLNTVSIPASVSSIAEDAFAGCGGVKSVEIPQYVCGTSLANVFRIAYVNITNVTIREGTTHIGMEAFTGCSELQSLSIPGSVTNIASGAFAGCSGLLSVTIPQYICSSRLDDFFPDAVDHITEVVIDDGVTSIGPELFKGCTALVSVYIPASVKSIGEKAFSGCESLAEIGLPASVESIGAYAFEGCSALESVAIPAGILRIEDGTFRGCSGLQSVSIPSGVASLGNEAFSDCSALEEVNIPAGVTYIGDAAFKGCTVLANVVVPDGVECIGDDAFEECNLLASIHLPVSLVDWGLRSLPVAMRDGIEFDTDGFMVVNGWVLGYRDSEVSTLVFPAGIVGVGNHALADFWDLETVEFPDSLKYIGRGAFETNTYLDNVVIPDGVEVIRSAAFQGCTYIRNLTIGESVALIGNEAFARCTQLATVSIPDSVVELGNGVFSNCWRLLSAKLPLGLERAGVGMFSGCNALTGVTMPGRVFTVARLFEEQWQKLESIAIVAGETDVCANAFLGCPALASVTLPTSLLGIGPQAFADCSALSEIELPEALKSIGEQAFARCTALGSIVFPDSVLEMGAETFIDCTALSNVTLSRSLAGVPDNAFQGCRQLTSLVIPASVKMLGANIGQYFTALYYLGNAPGYVTNTYSALQKPITTYVVQGSRGWDGIPSSRDLPESWLGYPITYWEPNRFDAHFDANGGVFADGSAVWSCEQITGVGYVLPPYAPTLAGADFDGWWTDPSEGAQIKATTRVNETREITFYAHWKGTPVPVTVRFNANGGTVVPAEGSYMATMPYGNLPVPTRVHYRFDGWWTAAEGGNKVVPTSRVPGADQELFAHWTPLTYAIRFHANGGEGTMADQSFTYGNPVTLRTNAFQREGWEFNGWALAEDGVPVYADGAVFAQVAAVEDGVIHLYATWWRGGSYAVRFDANGGTGRMDNQTFELGEAKALSSCQFSREGFQFLGWAMVSSGEVVYEDGAVVADLATEPDATVVLYAVWEKLPEPEPLPEITDDAEVAGVLANATDPRLANHIQTAADYADFRDWALTVKGSDGDPAGAEAVLASLHAWPSYLLGSLTLFENEPDIRLSGIELSAIDEDSRATRVAPGTMTVCVVVHDGPAIAPVSPSKVAALFCATSTPLDWIGGAQREVIATPIEGGSIDPMMFAITSSDETAFQMFLGIRE